MKRFENLEPSGIEWIGDVPAHWDSVSLRYVFSIEKGTIPDQKFEVKKEGMVPYLSMEYLRTNNSENYCLESDGVLIRDGDILILWDGSNAGELVLGRRGILSSTMSLLDLKSEEILKDFGYYYLKSWEREIRNNTVGMGIPHVDGSYLKNLKILLPPKEEQAQIVAFLNEKTEKLDSLIEKKERKIELLKEKRNGLINHAVTNGLNPDIQTKNSGIEWIGKIPRHWDLVMMRYIIRLQSGSSITSTEIEEKGEYPVYGGNGLRGYYETYTNEGEHILIGRQGALCGNINYASGKFWASEHALVAYPISEVNITWLGELLRLMNLNRYSVSAAQPGLAVDRISALKLPVPPLDEQNKIESWLQKQFYEIDELIDKESKKIELLKEYRQSLISEAVTGKIDVRKEVEV